jgi:multiple sugar transport system permease protein
MATVTRARTEPSARRRTARGAGERGWARALRLVALALGSILFLFPFYYMLVAAFQRDPRQNISSAFPNPAQLSLANFQAINDAINLGRTLLNSGIFTGAVLLLTLVFGLLAGYALAQLHWRGRNAVFYTMLLVLMLPFQMLIIPLYVLMARDFQLGDSYAGIILPFAINSTAVFIFRQFFIQLPRDFFEAARIDGASELQILTRIVIPLTRPAILTAVLVTFIGPWNEFLWPFLITKQPALQPLAVALANFQNNLMQRQANPSGSLLAGATVLALPVVILFLFFQRQFVQSSIGSGVKG